MAKSKHGGRRNKAGRKKIDPNEKIVQAYYFIKSKYLNSVGAEQAKQIARTAVEKASNI